MGGCDPARVARARVAPGRQVRVAIAGVILLAWAAVLGPYPRGALAERRSHKSVGGLYTVAPEEVHAIKHPERQFMGKRCPRYYILGQMKCGTTTLWKHAKKGLEFPNRKDMPKAIHVMDRHEALLELKFNKRPMPALEATPSYIRGLDPALRIKNYCNFTAGRPKFVVTLCDPANRTWSHFKHEEFSDQDHSLGRFKGGRAKLTGEALPAAYRQCVEESLPVVEECLAQFSYEQCWRLLYHSTAPGSHDVPDAWGLGRPCQGVIFASLFAGELDYWTAIFPRKDFLVVYRDDWLSDPVAAVDAMSRHFKVRRSKSRIDVGMQANFHAMFAGVTPPPDVQARLDAFFSQHSGWRRYVTRVSSTQPLPWDADPRVATAEPG